MGTMKGQITRVGVGLLCAICAVAASAQFSDNDKKALSDAFFIANAGPENFRYPRIDPRDKDTLPFVHRVLSDPLAGAETLYGLHQKSNTSISRLLLVVRREMLEDKNETPPAPIFIDDAVPNQVPQEFRPSLQRLAGAIQAANNTIRAAMSKLSESEQRALIESLPQWASNTDVKFDFVKQKPFSLNEVSSLIAKVDLQEIRRSAETLAAVAEREMAIIKQAAGSSLFLGKVEGRVGNVPFVFAGKGDDIHNERGAMLTVDIGGNDRYIGRHGAGIGYSSVMIDVDGSDTYDVPDASLGAGILGVGLAYDLGGNDTCRAKSLAFGAGVAGVGCWYKTGGDDDYRGSSLVQGFGYYGIGLCTDTSGDDTFTAESFAQGSARSNGVGWLTSLNGNNTYRTTAQESYSQGSSSGFYGWAPNAPGGIGMLTDLGGIDSYQAGGYSQAAGFGRACGSLFDANGDDLYLGGNWSIASSSREGGAFLFDSLGDDRYAGVSAACCCAIERSVSVLVDNAGSDLYSAGRSFIAASLQMGYSLLFDGGGIDIYSPRLGSSQNSSFSMSVDIGQLQLAGTEMTDSYGRYKDGFLRMLIPGGVSGSPDLILPPITMKPNTASMPTPPEMEKLFALASQRLKPTTLAEIADARNRLVSIGLEAVKWMVEKKLATATDNEIDVIGLVANAAGQDAINAVVLSINNPNESLAVGALKVSAKYAFKDAGALLSAAIQKPGLRLAAIQAAVMLKEKAAAPDLMLITAGQDRWEACLAAEALWHTNDPGSVGTAQVLLGAQEWPLRQSAFMLLAENPTMSLPIAKAMSMSTVEKEARLGMELLGRIGTQEALAEAVKGLKDQRPGVRIQALLALNERFPKEALPQLANLREDGDTRVRLVAKSVSIGR